MRPRERDQPLRTPITVRPGSPDFPATTPDPAYAPGMTQDRDEIYSPVPQPSHPPPRAPSPADRAWASPAGRTSYGQPYPPTHPPPPAFGGHQPFASPPPIAGQQPFNAPPPRPPVSPRTGKSRASRYVVVAAALVVVLAGAAALGQLVSSSSKVVADGQGRVSLRVPRAWIDYTEPDPDRAQTPDEEEDFGGLPDVETTSLLAGSDVVVYLDPPASGGLSEAHQANVEDACEQWTCLDQGSPERVIIDGQPGVQQVLTHFDDDEGAAVAVLLTVQGPDLMSSATATRYTLRDDPPSPDELIAILRTMTFTR